MSIPTMATPSSSASPNWTNDQSAHSSFMAAPAASSTSANGLLNVGNNTFANGNKVQAGGDVVSTMLRIVQRYDAGERGDIEYELECLVPSLLGLGLFNFFKPEEWIDGKDASPGRRFLGERAKQVQRKLQKRQLSSEVATPTLLRAIVDGSSIRVSWDRARLNDEHECEYILEMASSPSATPGDAQQSFLPVFQEVYRGRLSSHTVTDITPLSTYLFRIKSGMKPTSLESFWTDQIEIRTPLSRFSFSSQLKSSEMTLSNDNLTCTNSKNGGHHSVLGSQSYDNGVHSFQFRIDSLKDDEFIMFGVAASSASATSSSSSSSSSSASTTAAASASTKSSDKHDHDHLYADDDDSLSAASVKVGGPVSAAVAAVAATATTSATGQITPAEQKSAVSSTPHVNNIKFEKNDVVELTIDCVNGTFTIKNAAKSFEHVVANLPKKTPLTPQITLYGPSDAVTILERERVMLDV